MENKPESAPTAPTAPSTPSTEWGTAEHAGLVVLLRRDRDSRGERAIVMDAGDGIARVRILRLDAATRRWLTVSDVTVEAPATPCEPVDPDDEAALAALPMLLSEAA